MKRPVLTRRDESGFTLMEMAVAVAIGAFIFASLAYVLGGSLKSLAVQKARTQGNEVATLGMEDLQRLPFDRLHLCPPSASAPAPAGARPYWPSPDGFSEVVVANNCTSPAEYSPCAATSAGDLPLEQYNCRRGGTVFNVRRYIAWGDPSRTEKRLAVHVTWRDSAGEHEVAQQSSLRIPGRGALIGVAPPELSGMSVSPPTVAVTGGTNNVEIRIDAVATGLRTSDDVFAVFNVLEGTTPRSKEVPLVATTPDGRNWRATIAPNTFTFGQGSQFFVATAIRRADGKTNSRVSDVIRFCPTGDPGSCSATLPRIDNATVTPSSVDTDGAGALQGPLLLEATTANVSPADAVVAIFQTTGGAASVVLRPDDPSFTCDASTCNATWRAEIQPESGYRFAAASQYFYFTAYQGTDTGFVVDNGSTAARTSTAQVTFG